MLVHWALKMIKIQTHINQTLTVATTPIPYVLEQAHLVLPPAVLQCFVKLTSIPSIPLHSQIHRTEVVMKWNE